MLARYPRSAWLGLFLIPVLLGLVWGAYFDDAVYTPYRFAQNLAAGRGLATDAGIAPQLAPRSPLLIGILALFAPVMPPAGLLLSALGWGATAVILHVISKRTKRPFTAVIVPLLVVFIPLFPAASGSAASWVVALGWLAIMIFTRPLSENGRRAWVRQPIVLLLLLGAYFDVSTAGLTVLLLACQWRRSKKPPWPSLLVLLAAAASWLWFVSRRWDVWALVRPLSLDKTLLHLLNDNELFWLFLPFMLLGVWGVKAWGPEMKRMMILAAAWVAMTWLAGSSSMGEVTAVAAMLLAGLGIEWLVAWTSEKQIVRISSGWLALLLTAPLLLTQLLSLGQQYPARPAAQFTLEKQLSNWIQTHSEPDATLYATSRIGYLAQRPTLPADFAQQHPSDQLSGLITAEPDLIITSGDIAWHDITGAVWFRERYAPIQQFASAYVVSSPLTVWEHTHTPFDSGEIHPLNAVVSDKIKVVGYKYEPAKIQPGDIVHVTLYLQAIQPITVSFHTQTNLTYALDDWVWAWQRELTPRSVPGPLWQPGQIIPERFTLKTETAIPYGAYQLHVWWTRADDESPLPVHQNDDANVLDRIMLGYVAVPPPVDDSHATPVTARFDDQIILSGYEIGGELLPGETAVLTLYWQALRPPDDNYFVFVHLLDEAGQLVTNHDGQPMDNRFVTRSWLPGMLVADTHPLTLPPDLPPGNYRVMVGLYQRETGARLPVGDDSGVEQADGSWPLMQLTINNEQ